MPYDTDEKLKSYLDTNQLAREQLCLAVLALAPKYTNVVPRHPRGGPDGGRDISATYDGEHLAFAAVGFVNTANDSSQHKRQVHQKFKSDLSRALDNDPKPGAFVFMTNVNLTAGEKDELVQHGLGTGIAHCEIYDLSLIHI